MRSVFAYTALVGVMLWRLPQVRRQGQLRLTVLWALLWILAAVAVGLWLWAPETARLADWLRS